MKSLIAIVVFAVVMTSGIAMAGDEATLKKSDVPEAVLKAFEAAYPEAVVTKYSSEDVDGQIRYEFETEIDEIEKDYVYLADGTLLQIEEDVLVKDLPDAVILTVTELFPDGKIEDADAVTRDTTLEYQIIVANGEERFLLTIAPDGEAIAGVELLDVDQDKGRDGDKDAEKNDESDDDEG